MYRINSENLITDEEGHPLVVFVDSIRCALGVDAQSQTVIFRLWQTDWPMPDGLVPRERVHQFAMNASRAAELGRQLLELAAQAEKETGKTSH